MSSELAIKLDSKEAKLLQDVVQHELARRRWSEGEDDSVMSEYILVMVANRKTPAQIAAELNDLVGDAIELSEDKDSAEGGIDSFVKWLWAQGERIVGGDRDGQEARRRRRSASPSTSHRPDTQSSGNGRKRTQDDRWQSDRHQQKQPRRELFADSMEGSGGMASDSVQMGESGASQGLDGDEDQPKSLRVAGSARDRGLFRQSMADAHQSTLRQAAKGSIFARASVPDPRANEFVPRNAASQESGQHESSNGSLLSRLDPMLPDNSAAPSTASSLVVPSNFPTQPQDSSLCRWGLKCTSPACIYAHASASAVPRARQTGQEPLVLRADPCHYQKDCTKPDCEFSHVSPAVKFVLAKADRAANEAFGDGVAAQNQSSRSVDSNPASNSTASTVSCRYGADCYRKDCHFAHPPERSAHISDRLKQFGRDDVNADVEVIIPVA